MDLVMAIEDRLDLSIPVETLSPGAHHQGVMLRHPRLESQPDLVSLFDKFAPQRALQASLAESGAVLPIATPMDAVHSATTATIGGKRTVLAGTNNYLGLTFDAECRAAAIAAIEASGTGTTGSRMASGNYAGHRELEQALADAFGWAAGIVFSTGYQANLGALSGLVGSDEFLLIDADSHASIHDGCRLSNATTIRFRHNDVEDLDRRLGRLGADARRTLVVVESLYSTRGDRAPLREIVEVTKRHGAWLLVDEAHSFGVFGPRGLGLSEELGLLDDDRLPGRHLLQEPGRRRRLLPQPPCRPRAAADGEPALHLHRLVGAAGDRRDPGRPAQGARGPGPARAAVAARASPARRGDPARLPARRRRSRRRWWRCCSNRARRRSRPGRACSTPVSTPT